VSLSIFLIKAADPLIMYSNDQMTLELLDLQDQNSLTLCRCSFSEWGSKYVALFVADIASQYLISQRLQL